MVILNLLLPKFDKLGVETAEAESISNVALNILRPKTSITAKIQIKPPILYFISCKEFNSLSLGSFELGIGKPFFWYKNLLPKGLR